MEIDDPLIISNRFDEYFVNIGNNLANEIKTHHNIYEKYLGGTFQESMVLSPVTNEEINSTISTFGDTDDILKCISMNEKFCILIKIALKFVPKGPIDNIPALIQIMAWLRSGDKPLSESMLPSSLTHICGTRGR